MLFIFKWSVIDIKKSYLDQNSVNNIKIVCYNFWKYNDMYDCKIRLII